MNLDNKKDILKEIRRTQLDRAYHIKQKEYCNNQLEILNMALEDLETNKYKMNLPKKIT